MAEGEFALVRDVCPSSEPTGRLFDLPGGPEPRRAESHEVLAALLQPRSPESRRPERQRPAPRMPRAPSPQPVLSSISSPYLTLRLLLDALPEAEPG